MIINICAHNAPDLLNTNIKIELGKAIHTLNQCKHNGFDSWYWDSNLQMVAVGNKEILLNHTIKGITLENSFYYTLREEEAKLLAKHYLEEIYPGGVRK